MKISTTFFFTIVLAVLFSSNLQAQDDSGIGKNVIKVNPLKMLLGGIEVNYERALTPKSSAVVGASYFYNFLGSDVSALQLDAEYRFYFHKQKQAPTGFYAAPNFSFTYANSNNSTESGNVVGIGAGVGYQWVWNSGFVLDLGAGTQYPIVTVEGQTSNFSTLIPRLTFAVGYNF